MTIQDFEALWRLEMARNRVLVELGAAQQAEMDRVRDEHDMLARRAAEMAHELVALKCPK